MNVFSIANLPEKRLLVAFLAKVGGVVAKIFSVSPLDPLMVSDCFLAPSIQNMLSGP